VPVIKGGGHDVHDLSTMIVISHTFCMAKENELTPEGVAVIM